MCAIGAHFFLFFYSSLKRKHRVIPEGELFGYKACCFIEQ